MGYNTKPIAVIFVKYSYSAGITEYTKKELKNRVFVPSDVFKAERRFVKKLSRFGGVRRETFFKSAQYTFKPVSTDPDAYRSSKFGVLPNNGGTAKQSLKKTANLLFGISGRFRVF